ncbi:unnamed protein product [Mytilus coruscus]|uniref:C-type lectin domain-containing protein n=1 Tax=Mytilus coruscus TaxID=42192 RepID=A0A6J8EW27_MYTCO|nr:unnamed protein product [Mytilus coruscus]
MAMMGMMSPSSTTSVNNCQCEVTLPPTTQSSSPTASSTTNTPCVPTSCPPGYMLLPDENASPNCYLYSGGENTKSWDEARRTCAMTPGAFLWNPNSKTEANAVRSRFNIVPGFLWSGGKKDSNGKFVFEIDNMGLVYDQENIPFGISFDALGVANPDDECLVIASFPLDKNSLAWVFGPQPCTLPAAYVCEFSRVKDLSIDEKNAVNEARHEKMIV